MIYKEGDRAIDFQECDRSSLVYGFSAFGIESMKRLQGKGYSDLVSGSQIALTLTG